MKMGSNYYTSKLSQFSQQPFSVQWRAALVRLPWLVPKGVLNFTSPEGPHPELLYITSRGSHQIPVYVFVPPEPHSEKYNGQDRVKLPVHLDFHGGGFIMGSCMEQAPWCALVARRTGRIVVTVDYRKGPLDKFPAAIEDAEDVLAAILDSQQVTAAGRELHGHVSSKLASTIKESQKAGKAVVDTERISLSGFSSGGNIALNLVLSVEHDGKKWPTLFGAEGMQIPTLLFYPSFDSTMLPQERPRPPNMKESDTSKWFASIGTVLVPTYLPEEMRSHPRASPGLNDLRNCLLQRSKIYLVLPEIDTLAFQSEEWLKRVGEQQMNDVVEVHREEGMPHGWTQFPDRFLEPKQKERKYATFENAIEYIQRLGQ